MRRVVTAREFVGINRKNFFLGRAQIFPRQGTIFFSGGYKFLLVGVFY
jgi:hypothetical protein